MAKFECKKRCKECYHGKLHSHTYMCSSETGNCPKCAISSKKGEGNDKTNLYWKT